MIRRLRGWSRDVRPTNKEVIGMEDGPVIPMGIDLTGFARSIVGVRRQPVMEFRTHRNVSVRSSRTAGVSGWLRRR